MNAELKRKWVEALRSGKIAQGKTYLSHKGKMCCLGVLCLVAKEPIRDNHQGFPSVLFMSGIGINREAAQNLANMNDGCGEWTGNRMSFSAIADYIEANL